ENCYAWAEVSTSSNQEKTAGGIAGINQGTISTCYAAGTVQAEGTGIHISVGGIGGNNFNLISGCAALVSSLDAGLVSPATKYVYKIASNISSGSCTNNLARNDMAIVNNTEPPDPGSNNQDGYQESHTSFINNVLHWEGIATLSWHFPNNWKFLPAGSGYDYPVLNWQNRVPADPSSF
ncbi:MAG: hypothetical protein LBH26_04210, partial [Treponema sp.]|nr:hypothetical protein [Treponema sp.]